MAIEEIKVPWLYDTTALEQGYSVLYCRNAVAWTDVQRQAQNEADQTGKPQLIVKGDGHTITHEAHPDPRRHAALTLPLGAS